MIDGKPYHHGDLRDALLKASLDLMREVGTHEFTLREVARRAGVSHAAPYRHFRDKTELFAAIAEQGFERLVAAMQVAVSQARHPFDRLRSAGVAYVEFAQDEPEQFSVMFAVDLNEKVHPSAKAAADRCFAELVTLIRMCHQDSSEGDRQNRHLALIAWAQVHGIAELALRRQLGFKKKGELRKFAEAAIAVFGRGLNLASQ